MSKAQVIHKLGPPEAMVWQDWPVRDAAPGGAGFRRSRGGGGIVSHYTTASSDGLVDKVSVKPDTAASPQKNH